MFQQWALFVAIEANQGRGFTMLRGLIAFAAGLALTSCSLLGGTPEQELDDLIVGVHYVGINVSDIEASAE